MGAKCCDQIVEGYLILNTEINVKAGYYVLENDGYEGVNSVTSRVINVIDSSPGGNPQGAYL
jgi:hypothetical protein